MDTRTKQRVVLSTLMAFALSAQSVAAQSGSPIGPGSSIPGSFGRALSDSEMDNLRGGYLPPSGNMFIDVRIEYDSDARPFAPTSLTVIVSAPGTNANQAAPSQTIVLTPEQAINVRGAWTVTLFRDPDGTLSRSVSAGGAWTGTLFRDPDN